MQSNELLEEIWAIREQLAREAGHDLHEHVRQLREFMKAHPHKGPVLRTQEEVDRYIQHGELPAASVCDDDLDYGKPKA